MRKRSTYWDIVKRELKPKFALAGLLNVCELQWNDCLANDYGVVPDVYQTFAHSLRRRHIDKYKKYEKEIYEEKMRKVIRVCTICHDQLDKLPKHKTEHIVENVIASRKRKII